MVDVTEILVHWHAGRSLSEIAESLGVERKTVRKYVAPAVAAGYRRAVQRYQRPSGASWYGPGSRRWPIPGCARSPGPRSRCTAITSWPSLDYS